MLPHPLVAPAKVYIDLTARCNLRCRYCYHFDSPAAVAATGRCNFVQLSFDGPAPVHDFARGEGSFQDTLNAIHLLKRHHLPIRLRATIGKHNLGYLAATARIAFDELDLPELVTNCVSVENLCCKDASSLELTLPELLAAAHEHRQLLPRYAGRLKSSTGPWGMVQKWKALYQLHLRHPNSNPKFCGRLSGCGAVFRQLGVRARREVSLAEFPECRCRRYLHVCRGGCPASGVLDASSPPRKVCKHCLADVEKLLTPPELDFLLNS